MDVVPGHRVTVPFGRRSTYGFVVSLGTEEPAVETKPIATAGAAPPVEQIDLTDEQKAALDVIATNSATLLHGVIGSGKTEVYLAAAERALAEGLRVLLLVPDISLTPQLVQRVRARLNAPVAVLHTQLTELERAQQWWRTR